MDLTTPDLQRSSSTILSVRCTRFQRHCVPKALATQILEIWGSALASHWSILWAFTTQSRHRLRDDCCSGNCMPHVRVQRRTPPQQSAMWAGSEVTSRRSAARIPKKLSRSTSEIGQDESSSLHWVLARSQHVEDILLASCVHFSFLPISSLLLVLGLASEQSSHSIFRVTLVFSAVDSFTPRNVPNVQRASNFDNDLCFHSTICRSKAKTLSMVVLRHFFFFFFLIVPRSQFLSCL